MGSFLTQPDASRAVRPLFDLLVSPLRAGRADWETRANDACLNLSQLLETDEAATLPPAEADDPSHL